MKNRKSFRLQIVAWATCCLGLLVGSVQGATLVNFPFNEGAGILVQDTAQGLVGSFGLLGADPAIDSVALTNDSPSGLPGDRSFVNNRGGFLLADDSATGSLNITNGPITIEAWVKVNPNFRLPNEGIAAYGNSYKLGLRSRKLTFTLFGIRDIETTNTTAFPVDSWVHVAAAWTPGSGVDFYVTSGGVTTHTFTSYTAASAARPVQHNYVSVGSEGLAVPLVGTFDRVKIHNKILSDVEMGGDPTTLIDNDPAIPKANYAETIVAYDFNESELPSLNSVVGAPTLPLTYGNPISAAFWSPVWTNDSPTGLTNDFALAFNLDIPINKQRINLDFKTNQVSLGANNTNYTLEAWVKLPTTNAFTNRMVVLRTSGSGPRASLSINTNRTLWSTIYGNADFPSSVVLPNDAAWHHVAVVVSNFAQVHFYLDGVLGQTLNRTAAGVPTGVTGATNLLIGLETDPFYFKGLLDRVRISNSALSASELDSVAVPLPKLSIQSNGSGSFVLTWPASFEGYTLESAGSIPSASWTGESHTVVGDQNSATIAASPQNRFYRLRK